MTGMDAVEHLRDSWYQFERRAGRNVERFESGRLDRADIERTAASVARYALDIGLSP